MLRPTQSEGYVANSTFCKVNGSCNMIANIQGGVAMISNVITIISFVLLIISNIIDPLDCLGY